MQFSVRGIESLPGIEQHGKSAKRRACISTAPDWTYFPAPQIRAHVERMSEHDTSLRGEIESSEIPFPLPMGYENKTIDGADELFVLAPINPTLVDVMVHPKNARPLVAVNLSRMVHLQVDRIKIAAHSLPQASDH